MIKLSVSVDVVIPTYRPGEDLLDLLEMLKKQTKTVNKIIIINTEQEFFDEKLYNISGNILVHHIKKSEFDHAATRNMALRMSDADYVMFMTMDAVPANEKLVETLLEGFNNPDIAVVYARQLPKRNCRLQEQFTRSYNYPEENMVKTKNDLHRLGIKTYFCSDVCAMYDKKIYDALGGFVEKAIFNEDMFYAAKAIQNDYAIMYMAKAKVYHSHNYTCMEQFRRNFDLGVSHAEHPEIFEGISSEKEGIGLVKSTAKFLISQKKWYMIPYLVVSSAYKYSGYRLGKKYKKLSYRRILKCTSNRNYWMR